MSKQHRLNMIITIMTSSLGTVYKEWVYKGHDTWLCIYHKSEMCAFHFFKYIIIWARCMGEPFWLGLLVCWGLFQFNINVSHSTIFFLTNINETVHISSLMNISSLPVFENKEKENYMLWSYMNIKKTYLT